MYDVTIVGSGPAGMAAAIYAKRAMLDTLVVDKTSVSGGQILNTYEVDNYPGLPEVTGMDLGKKFKDHAVKLGAEFTRNTISFMARRGILRPRQLYLLWEQAIVDLEFQERTSWLEWEYLIALPVMVLSTRIRL